MRRSAPFLIIISVLVLSVSGGALLYRVKERRIAVVQAAAAANPAKALSSINLGADPPHVRNSLSARVRIEEFGDFQCPSCAALSPTLGGAARQYNAELCVIFRQFPILAHKHAQDAARASEAAGLQGRFWEIHDLLYASQLIWTRAADTRELFTRFAQSLGLDLERFKIDMESDQVNTRIVADQQRAASLGVDRTPAIFINGQRVPDASLNQKALQETIDLAVNQKTR
jgi:protein-disulfide isomerase